MPCHCVVSWQNVFSKITRFVCFDQTPVNEEVSLTCLILDPMEYHVHCFGYLFGGGVDNTLGSVFLSLYWFWVLLMAKFFEYGAQWYCVLSII